MSQEKKKEIPDLKVQPKCPCCGYLGEPKEKTEIEDDPQLGQYYQTEYFYCSECFAMFISRKGWDRVGFSMT